MIRFKSLSLFQTGPLASHGVDAYEDEPRPYERKAELVSRGEGFTIQKDPRQERQSRAEELYESEEGQRVMFAAVENRVSGSAVRMPAITSMKVR